VNLPWWGWLAFIGLIVAGTLQIIAPVLGKLWADRDEERRRWAREMRRQSRSRWRL
jgi:hypothetical protein